MSNPITSPIRRNFLRLLATTAALWAAGSRAQAPDGAPAQLRIGYQKSAANLVVIKQSGWLEKRLPHTKVAWVEFPAVLPAIIESHRTGATLIAATTELAATARGRHQHHLADAAAWLLLRDLEDDTAAS